jgi:hypothetical protein
MEEVRAIPAGEPISGFIADVQPDPTAFREMQDIILTGTAHAAALLVIYPEAYDGGHRDLIWTTAFQDDPDGREKAQTTAQSLRGVVACVPIVYDYREPR